MLLGLCTETAYGVVTPLTKRSAFTFVFPLHWSYDLIKLNSLTWRLLPCLTCVIASTPCLTVPLVMEVVGNEKEGETDSVVGVLGKSKERATSSGKQNNYKRRTNNGVRK